MHVYCIEDARELSDRLCCCRHNAVAVSQLCRAYTIFANNAHNHNRLHVSG